MDSYSVSIRVSQFLKNRSFLVFYHHDDLKPIFFKAVKYPTPIKPIKRKPSFAEKIDKGEINQKSPSSSSSSGQPSSRRY